MRPSCGCSTTSCPQTKATQGSNFCDVAVLVDPDRTAGGGGRRSRQPGEGSVRPGDPVHESDVRLAGGRVMGTAPLSVTGRRRRDRDATGRSRRSSAGNCTSPAGYRAAGVHCGLKKSSLDLALVVSDRPASVAGVFTTNQVKAAPVLYSQRIVASGAARAIVCNSGNANACTGEAGLRDTPDGRCAGRRGARPGLEPGDRGLDRRHRRAARHGEAARRHSARGGRPRRPPATPRRARS